MNAPLHAREAAVRILIAVDAGKAFADERLDQVRTDGSLEARDLALLRRIVLGTLRRKLTLDCVLAAFSNRPIRRIQPRPLASLRSALYQILFLDRIPAAAATDEAVKLAGRRAAGFVNGLLRSTVRALAEEPADDPMRSLRFTGRSLSFARPVFPHPDDDLLEHLAATYSHPTFLVERLLDSYGEQDVRGVLEAANHAPAVFVRVNTLTGSVEEVASELDEAGIAHRPTHNPALLGVETVEGLVDLRAFAEGRFYIQDASAARVAPLLDPKPGEAILDVCAAPGGKCSHLAQLTGDRARIVATDQSEARLARVTQNVERLKIRSVSAVCRSMYRPHPDFDGRFDKVLLDVPCSNSGVFAKRPEARYRLNPESLDSLIALQRRLLEAAATCLKPGGVLVYSTCSVLPEENERVVRRFLADHGRFGQTGGFQVFPSAGGPDGAYAARLIMV